MREIIKYYIETRNSEKNNKTITILTSANKVNKEKQSITDTIQKNNQ